MIFLIIQRTLKRTSTGFGEFSNPIKPFKSPPRAVAVVRPRCVDEFECIFMKSAEIFRNQTPSKKLNYGAVRDLNS